MHTNLQWIPYEAPIIVVGSPICLIYVVNQQSGGSSPAFAVPASSDSKEWTPRRYGTFLHWWSTNRQFRPDDELIEFLVRTAFSNWELRILAHRDDRLLLSMAELQQRHQNMFLRTGLSQKLNQLAQLSCYSQGVDHHLGKIDWLQELCGFSWGKAEVNLKLTGLFEAEANLDDVSAFHAVYATLNAEEQTRFDKHWPSSEGVFFDKFNEMYPSGFKLRRPAERTPFIYQPSHPDVGHSLHPSINLSLQVYDFYADGQLDPLRRIFLRGF